MSVAISINEVIKKYDETTVIPGLTTTIKNGEFFTLLGPSGCGKTTLLRMIAGFNSIEGGEISFNKKVINDIPAHKRDIGMVFQNYAIFPHLSVRKNVEYGLKLRKVEKEELNKRVDDILDVVKIASYQDRLPENLSGGQQQRVALARAIVINPSVLLMDEPLSNLDAKLRVEMRSAIREIQREVGITTVYVTHDQEEALAISDRIAVMKDGTIQQLGSPERIYARPYNTFVSTFIGHSNSFEGTLTPNTSGNHTVKIGGNFEFEMNNIQEGISNTDVLVSVRPEEFVISETGLPFVIKNRVFLGKYMIYEVTLKDNADRDIEVQLSQDIGQTERLFDVEETIHLNLNVSKINIFTQDGEKNLIQGVGQYE